jgi:hypothetical protein
MKKIIFIIIGTLYSLSGMSQQMALSDTVNIKMPNGTEKLSRDQFSDYVNNKFKNSKSALYIIPNHNARIDNKHFFKVNNVVVLLVHGKRREKDKDTYLSEQKKYFDNLYNTNKDDVKYSSVIKTINNNNVLITHDVVDNVGCYRFFCNDSTNIRSLYGVLQFDEADEAAATELLNKILNEIKFVK